MKNEKLETAVTIEKFGVSRNVWRFGVLAAFALLAVCGLFFSLTKGALEIDLAQVCAILQNPGADAPSQIIWNIRMPRTIVGALVGVNLALAGAILQAIMRNPLADPHIIGISSGAGLAGVTVMILFPTLEYLITPVAFIGAMLAAVCIYILAWKNGIKPVRVILAGVAVSAFLGSGISALMIFYSDRVHGALMWMVGGLAARSWQHVSIILPYALAGLLLALVGAAYLNILQLGDEMARGLGVNVELVRIAMTAVAALLAASAVSVVGLLGFVGLVVPHAARMIIGSDYRFLLPASALLGIGVVTLSDTFARVIFAPIELPVGIIMAFVGAPFFLFLLRREL
ncbi:MAG: iron ABC transporter permease [Acidaminococcaceae bacterium]